MIRKKNERSVSTRPKHAAGWAWVLGERAQGSRHERPGKSLELTLTSWPMFAERTLFAAHTHTHSEKGKQHGKRKALALRPCVVCVGGSLVFNSFFLSLCALRLCSSSSIQLGKRKARQDKTDASQSNHRLPSLPPPPPPPPPSNIKSNETTSTSGASLLSLLSLLSPQPTHPPTHFTKGFPPPFRPPIHTHQMLLCISTHPPTLFL